MAAAAGRDHSISQSTLSEAGQTSVLCCVCGRVGRPHELADLFTFLLSKRATYMTGAIINQDGGTQFF